MLFVDLPGVRLATGKGERVTGVEVLHVISGVVTVRFADRSVHLDAGDALTFPGREPHTWQVDEEHGAEVCWVLSPAPWSGSA